MLPARPHRHGGRVPRPRPLRAPHACHSGSGDAPAPPGKPSRGRVLCSPPAALSPQSSRASTGSTRDSSHFNSTLYGLERRCADILVAGVATLDGKYSQGTTKGAAPTSPRLQRAIHHVAH
eukprot:1188858-Prorocentrum_minimum.AAC.1